MKIGIITFHKALNYGAVLQAYALCEYLNDRYPDVTAEIVDYRCPALTAFYSLENQKRGNVAATLIKQAHFLLKAKLFADFLKKHIPVSPVVYDVKNIDMAGECYDKLITGSDQVWNDGLTGGDGNYLLAFAPPKKRYAYGASMGKQKWEDAVAGRFASELNAFKRLSLRETSSLACLREMGVTAEAESHIDPTLLLPRQTWEKLRSKRSRKKAYVFVYAVDYSPELIREAVRFARPRGLEVVYVGQRSRERHIRYLPLCAPAELLTLFKDADYVFTNSFHGTAFSLILQKQFYVKARCRDEKSSRITDMLHMLHLEDRMEMTNMDNMIDWERTERILDDQRRKSGEYLNWIVDNDNETLAPAGGEHGPGGGSATAGAF